MVVGGYLIPKRLLLIFGGLLVGLIVVYLMWPKPNVAAKQAQLALEPAFGIHYMESLQPGWLAKFASAYGEVTPQAATDYQGPNWIPSVGRVMHLSVYIPDVSGDANLSTYVFRGHGYLFMPALFLPRDQPTTPQDLQQSLDPSSSSFLVLGFPETQAPTPGQAVELTGMLWGRTDVLQSTIPNAPASPQPEPVFVVDGQYTALDPEELSAPTTQTEDLDLRYQENGQQVLIRRAEWSAGREVRLAVTLTNLGNASISAWSGISSSTASLPLQASQPCAAAGNIANAGNLDAQQSVSGYIVCQGVADPSQTLTLRMPTLSANQQNGDGILLELKPDSTSSPAKGGSS